VEVVIKNPINRAKMAKRAIRLIRAII